jgi:hypothetical protein
MTPAKPRGLGPEKFPRLRQFVGGYLHEDFVQEHHTPTGARDAYLRDASRDERTAFEAEAAAFLEATDHLGWSEVRAAFGALGGAWLPRSRAALAALLRVEPPGSRRAGVRRSTPRR